MKRFLYRFWRSDSKRKVSWIRTYLHKTDKVLDLGAGPCWVTSLLREEQFNVIPLDIEDLSIIDGIGSNVYDGRNIPYSDNEFDVALILTVLHHVKDPINLLKEVKRVSRRTVIIEDIYSNKVQMVIVKFLDSILNFEFKDHPHNNRNDKEWKTLFKDMRFTLKDTQYHKMMGIFTQSVYLLE